MSQKIFYTASKQQITLENKLAAGGEGAVWTLQDQPKFVAKLYFPKKLTSEKEPKLRAMVSNPPIDNMKAQDHISIAWPTELLYDAPGNGNFVGYMMPYIEKTPTLHTVYHPKKRAKVLPNFNWLSLLRTAQNFAIAIEALHAHGYIMGDINESNLLVTKDALVTLIDTDSFQVIDQSGRIFRCPVGKAEYTPQELQGKDFSKIDRKFESDYFGLAVLIFQLLMQGVHPFAGVLKNPNLSINRVDLHSVKYGLFPYNPNESNIIPPPNGLPFNILHPDLQRLFIRCFVDGHLKPQERPSPKVWREALAHAENALIHCKQNQIHLYANHLNECPWCNQERRTLPRQPQVPKQKPLDSTSAPTTGSPTPAQPMPPAQPPPISQPPPPPPKLTWHAWRKTVQTSAIFGLLSGFPLGLGISNMFSNPEISSGGAGVLIAIIILGIFIVIARSARNWFLFFVGVGLACWMMSASSNIIAVFVRSHQISLGWLYPIACIFGGIVGGTWGNFRVRRKFNQSRLRATWSSITLALGALGLMYFTGALNLPFESVAGRPASTPSGPIPRETSTRTPRPSPTIAQPRENVQSPDICSEVYIAKHGDTVSKIADRFLGDVLAFEQIVDATNQAHALDPSFTKLDSPDDLEIGDKLCIPAEVMTVESAVHPTNTATKRPSPTSTMLPTKSPTRTPTSTPDPTATSEQVSAPTPCSKTVEGNFAQLWRIYSERLGCPRESGPLFGQFAEMPFERGHLFWIGEIDIYGNTKQIIATFGGQNEGDSGDWSIHADVWVNEGICGGLPPPPSGLYFPDRGIAKVWCEINGLDRLGYATAPAEFSPPKGIDALQNFDNGVIFRDSDGQSRGLVYILFWDSMTYNRVRYQ